MSVTFDEIEKQVRLLSPEERARLAKIVLASLQPPPSSEVEAQWNQELLSRVTAYDRSEMESYPAKEVFAEAKRIAR